MNILVAGFQHETNTFATSPATYERFLLGEDFPALRRGREVLDLVGVNLPISGFIECVRERGHSVKPVIWAGAGASAHVTTEAFERIAGEIVDAARAGDVDAVYLDLHGAMVTQDLDDGEGELLARLREVVGPRMMIVASLDSHANVTDRMRRLADGLVAYRTYPHVDMAETGRRAAELLIALSAAGAPPFRSARRVPFLIPVNGMSTLLEPARSTYALLRGEEGGDVLSLSFAPGFPAADFPECGPVVWGCGWDKRAVEQAVQRVFDHVCAVEARWRVDFETPDAAVRRAIRVSGSAAGPVLLADTQDNPSAGGTASTTGLLRSLLKAGARDAAIGLICDPDAAAAAHGAGVGRQVTLDLGGCPQAGYAPLRATYRVEQLSDGRCVLGGPMMTGKPVDLGPMARLSLEGVEIAVSSVKAQLLDRNMLRVVGIDPERKKILVLKSSVHFRADFAGIAQEIIVVRAPGPFVADPSQLPWRRLAPGMRTGPCGPVFDGP
ncbi:M81 family metallopeptidase [Mitsuaria sp. 7]|uniref:M81 family metallopeptidase n=1 Tax=Mitsuaria sp. 7 TaxID=1658665 RepID=UPI0007DE34DA|nr:M81 family metallopeptidase [Mitsuaria sp. 7]ANH67082.1 microcystin degradation protein MlrC [Mitsuaria sp. 7]